MEWKKDSIFLTMNLTWTIDLDQTILREAFVNIFIGLSVEKEEDRASSKLLLFSLKVELFPMIKYYVIDKLWSSNRMWQKQDCPLILLPVTVDYNGDHVTCVLVCQVGCLYTWIK